MQADQLRLQMAAGRVFDGFQEGSVTFRPTYKYDPGTDVWDSRYKRPVGAAQPKKRKLNAEMKVSLLSAGIFTRVIPEKKDTSSMSPWCLIVTGHPMDQFYREVRN